MMISKQLVFIGACTALLGLAACSPHSQTPTASEDASVTVSDAPAPAPSQTTAAQPVVAPGTLLSCAGPIDPKATAKSLLAAYGKDAQLGTIPGAEGMESKALLLYDAIPAKKLAVTFWDDSMQHISGVSPMGTAWTGPSGIHVGSTLAYIQQVNGKPFSISGFGWDYGGYAVDFKGGALDKLPGGCTISLRFDGPDNIVMPDGINGDGVTLSSDDPRLKKWSPAVSELSLGWPLPDGVKPSDN